MFHFIKSSLVHFYIQPSFASLPVLEKQPNNEVLPLLILTVGVAFPGVLCSAISHTNQNPNTFLSNSLKNLVVVRSWWNDVDSTFAPTVFTVTLTN